MATQVLSAEMIAELGTLQGKAATKSLTSAEGVRLVELIGILTATTSAARESVKESGLSVASEQQQKTMVGIAESLTYNVEGQLRYYLDIVLGNTLARYNSIAVSLKLPQYASAVELYNNLDKLPPIFSASVREGRKSARARYQKGWGEELDKLNKLEGKPKNSPTDKIKG